MSTSSQRKHTHLSHLRATPLQGAFLFGSAYYPEHWDEKIRAADPALFAAAGWNVVRMGEFAWNLLEPREDHFDFSLFDATISRFAAVGIRTIFCTPTAAPPRWLTRDYPEVLRVDADGRRLEHGSRQQASHFSAIFRERSRRITKALAEHYKDNPSIIGWQTDNEFHCHFSEDYSSDAQKAFAEFLSLRHKGDIQALNRAWGTAFWAQTYDKFEEIPLPRTGRPTWPNPAHMLDFYRFLSAGVTAFQHEQVALLRAANPDWFITHNGCFSAIDYRGDFTRDLDFLGYDVYPFFNQNASSRPASQAANLDYTRSYSGNFLLVEQQSGPGGQGTYLHDTPEPGEMRAMAWRSIARGADGLLLFRERSCRFGAEEYWCGVLDHDNVPRRRYQEAARLGSELRRVGHLLLGSHVRLDIGIAGGDFDATHGHLPLSHGLPTPRHAGELIHQWFYTKGHAVGFVHPADTLQGLSLYFIPHYALFDSDWLPGLSAWVEKGGTLVIGARTACKDLDNNVIAATLPGLLRPLVGASVEDYGRQNRPADRPLKLRLGTSELCTEHWYESLQIDPQSGAHALASWTSGHLAGNTAITHRRHGRGHVLYVGTYFTPALLDALAPILTDMHSLPSAIAPAPGIEAVDRISAKGAWRLLINTKDETVTLQRPSDCTSLLDTDTSDTTVLPPFGVAIWARSSAGEPTNP